MPDEGHELLYEVHDVWLDDTTLRRSSGSDFDQQRNRAGHPAHKMALRAYGMVTNTIAWQYA